MKSYAYITNNKSAGTNIQLKLHESFVYLKIYHYSEMNHDKTIEIYNNLKDFFLNQSYNISGLNLSGDHFYRDILFDNRNPPFGLDEIKKIRQIKPIMDINDHLPYIYHRDYIDLCIPGRICLNKSVSALIDHINEMNIFFSRLTNQVQWTKIEIHFKFGLIEKLLNEINQYFSNKNLEIALKNFSFNENCIINPINYNHYQSGSLSQVKISDEHAEIIIQPIQKRRIGMSIYYDDVDLFNNLLKDLWDNGLFEQLTPSLEKYSVPPNLALL
jgi:hypothetical protein